MTDKEIKLLALFASMVVTISVGAVSTGVLVATTGVGGFSLGVPFLIVTFMIGLELGKT